LSLNPNKSLRASESHPEEKKKVASVFFIEKRPGRIRAAEVALISESQAIVQEHEENFFQNSFAESHSFLQNTNQNGFKTYFASGLLDVSTASGFDSFPDLI